MSGEPRADSPWVIIDLPYACFAIEIDDHGIVTKAAPIGRWMIGKRINDVLRWAVRKGAKVTSG